MQKTKLGITISGLAAAIYLTCLFGGYIPAIILTGYVLMVEENEWLRRNAVKAIVLMMIFSVLIYGINLIPNVINCFEDMARAFGVSVEERLITGIFAAVVDVVDILRTIVFLILGLKSLKMRTIIVPSAENIINKIM